MTSILLTGTGATYQTLCAYVVVVVIGHGSVNKRRPVNSQPGPMNEASSPSWISVLYTFHGMSADENGEMDLIMNLLVIPR